MKQNGRKIVSLFLTFIMVFSTLAIVGITSAEQPEDVPADDSENGLPDLQVAELRADAPVIYLNQINRLVISVVNQGNATALKVIANITDIVPKVSEKLISVEHFGALQLDMEKTRFIDWTPTTRGIHYIKVEIKYEYLTHNSPAELVEGPPTILSAGFPVSPLASEEYWGPGGPGAGYHDYNVVSLANDPTGIRFRDGPLTIFLVDDLIIESGATLQLNESVTLIMMNEVASPHEFEILVNSGAKFIIDSPSRTTTIQSPSSTPTYTYPFHNHGTVEFLGADVTYTYGDPILTNPGGVQNHPSSTCIIDNCNLVEADTHSLYIDGTADVQVKGAGTTIGSLDEFTDRIDGHGIFVKGATPIIEDVTVQYHELDGIHIEHSISEGAILASNLQNYASNDYDYKMPSLYKKPPLPEHFQSINPLVAVGDAAHAVWITEEIVSIGDPPLPYTYQNIMYTQSRDAGTTWSEQISVVSVDARIPPIYPPSLEIASDGQYVGVVYSARIVGWGLYLVYSDDSGETWSDPTRLPNPYSPTDTGLHICIDWQGDTAYIVYQTDPIGLEGIFRGIAFRTFANGEPGEIVELFETGGYGVPRIAVDEDDIHVIFCAPQLSDEATYFKGSISSGIWEDPITLTTYQTDGVFFDQKTFDLIAKSGAVYFVWHNYDTDNYNINYMKSDDQENDWLLGTNLDTYLLTTDPGNSLNPSCTFDSNMNLHVVWQDDRTGDKNIRYSRISSLGFIVPEANDIALTLESADSINPCIAIAQDERVFLIWEDERSGDSEIYIKRSHQLVINKADIFSNNKKGMFIGKSNPTIQDCSINGNPIGIHVENGNRTTIIDCEIQDSLEYGVALNQSTCIIKNNTFFNCTYGIYADNCIGEWGSVTSFSDGATEKTFNLERGDPAVSEIMIPDNSVITDASIDILYQDYVPPIEYQQNASYRGLNTTYFYDVSLNDTLSYNVPADWDVEYLAIYIENITVDGIETTLGDMNITAEHNSTNIQFENRSNRALFLRNRLNLTAPSLEFNISTSTQNVTVNLTLHALLKKDVPIMWQSIPDGYGVSVPLTSPDGVSLLTPRLLVGISNLNFAEIESSIEETTQDMQEIYINKDYKAIVFNLSNNAMIGSIWEPGDYNTTLSVNIKFFSESISLDFLGDGEDILTIGVESGMNLTIKDNLADTFNKILIDNALNESYITLVFSVPYTGEVTISNVNIYYKKLPIIHKNSFQGGEIGTNILWSEVYIVDNVFNDSSMYGVNLDDSYSDIYYNNISRNKKGILFVDSTATVMWNEIHSNEIGIQIENVINQRPLGRISDNTISSNNIGISGNSRAPDFPMFLKPTEAMYDVFYIANARNEIILDLLENSLMSDAINYTYNQNVTLPRFTANSDEVYLWYEDEALVFDYTTIDPNIKHKCYVTLDSVVIAFSHNYSVPYNTLFQDISTHSQNRLATTELLTETIAYIFKNSGAIASGEVAFATTLINTTGYLLQSATNDYGTSTSSSWTEFSIPPDNTVVQAWLRGNSVGNPTLYPNSTTEWPGVVNQSVLEHSQTTPLRVTTRDLKLYDRAGGASLFIITEGQTAPTEIHSHPDQDIDLEDEVFISSIYGINREIRSRETTLNIEDNILSLNNISITGENISVSVYKNEISSQNVSIYFDNSTCLLEKNYISTTAGYDISSKNASSTIVIDSKLDIEKLVVDDNNSTIDVYQHMRTTVLNETGNPKQGVDVSIETSEKEVLFNDITDDEGKTGAHLVRIINPTFEILPENITAIDGNHSYFCAKVEFKLSPDVHDIEIYIGQDMDNDGLTDGEERFVYFTDVTNNDTDEDGLLDGLELGLKFPHTNLTNVSLFKADSDPETHTIPLVADTDSDGIDDGKEDMNLNGKVDPNEPIPTNPDSDGDGIWDGLEIGWFMDTDGDGYINALDLDSDDDGLPDGVEDANLNGKIDNCEPSPINKDSNSNGIEDGNETELIEIIINSITGPDRYYFFIHNNRFPENANAYYDSGIDIDITVSLGYIQNNIYITVFNETDENIGEFFITTIGNENIVLDESGIILLLESRRFSYPLTLNDNDGDGMADIREAIYLSTRVANFTSYDLDGDNLTGILDTDSDDDGISDGNEVGGASYFGTENIPDINIYPTQERPPYLYKGSTIGYDAYFKETSNSGASMVFITEKYVFSHKLISLMSDGVTLSQNQNVTGKVTGNKIEYVELYTHTDLCYEIQPALLKGTYTITSSLPLSGDQSISFEEIIGYDSTNLTLWADGSIQISDFETNGTIELKSGTASVASLLPTIAIDAVGTTENCIYQVQMSPSQLVISTVISGGFMVNATYPIVVDPIIKVIDTAIWPYDSPQGWYPDSWFTHDDQGPMAVGWSDVDQDGDDDLATAVWYRDDVTTKIYINLHFSDNGNVSTSESWTFSYFSSDKWALYLADDFLKWADIDNDGDEDLIVANTAYAATYWVTGIKIFENKINEGELLEYVWSETLIGMFNDMSFGDYNNDTYLDLALAVAYGARVYTNTGDGNVTKSYADTADWEVGEQFDGYNAYALEWGDIDNDGDLDLVTDAYVHENIGGTLNQSMVWTNPNSTSTLPTTVSLGDINGDGFLDYCTRSDIIMSSNAPFTQQSYWVDHPFINPILLDVDNDTDLDVISSGDQWTGMKYYPNINGNISQNSAWDYWPNILAIDYGDFDGDLDMDLAIVNDDLDRFEIVRSRYSDIFKAIYPTNLTANNETTTSITLSWNENNPEVFDHYEVYYSKYENFSLSKYYHFFNIPFIDYTTLVVRNLEPNTTYYFAVFAVGTYGIPGVPGYANATTKAIFAPVPPVADAGPNITVEVNTTVWLDGSASYDPNPDGNITGYYWSYYCIDSDGIPIPFDELPELSEPRQAVTSFFAEIPGVYIIWFSVMNNYLLIDTDIIYVHVLSPGTSPGSDPLDNDSDDDGLTDGEELALGTDKNNPDHDGDGLLDGEEVYVWNTSPLEADSEFLGVWTGERWIQYIDFFDDFSDPQQGILDIPPNLLYIEPAPDYRLAINIKIIRYNSIDIVVDDFLFTEGPLYTFNYDVLYQGGNIYHIQWNYESNFPDEYDMFGYRKVCKLIGYRLTITDLINGHSVSVYIYLYGNANNDIIRLIQYGYLVGSTAASAIGALAPAITLPGITGQLCGLGLDLSDNNIFNPYYIDESDGQIVILTPTITIPESIEVFTDYEGWNLYLVDGFYETKTYEGKIYARGFGREYIQHTYPGAQSLFNDIITFGIKSSPPRGRNWLYTYTSGGNIYKLIVNNAGYEPSGVAVYNNNFILRLEVEPIT